MSDDCEPVPGFLASNLVPLAQTHEKLRPVPASSGSTALDQAALDGGLRYGEITSIAGASGMGKTLIAFHVMASHLINHEKGEIAFIDTTGSFSPLRLRDVLAFRLQAKSRRAKFQQAGYIYEKAPQSSDVVGQAVTEQATTILDRVKVMRVFEYAGVVEAIGEVGEMWEAVSRAREEAKEREAQSHNATEGIADSEDESEEMLDDPGRLERSSQTQNALPPCLEETGQIGVIVIDTITNVVSAMMSKSQVQGQALLTTSLRSLAHLTSRHHILTLLLNSAVGLHPPSTNPKPNPSYPRQQRRLEDNVSVFASTQGKPALGKTFAYLIDTSVFLSQVPKRRGDAEVAFGQDGRGGRDGGWEKVRVMEVVRDRNGGREGMWGVWEIVRGVGVGDAVF